MMRKHYNRVETPAFCVEMQVINDKLDQILSITRALEVKLLFPLKAQAIRPVLTFLSKRIDGFAVSSAFEAILASETTNGNQIIQFYSTGISQQSVLKLMHTCNTLVFNSLTQVNDFCNTPFNDCEIGIRINTGLSFVKDKRYDPCGIPSKLGVPLFRVRDILARNASSLLGINGALVHSNCESEDFNDLLETTYLLDKEIPEFMKQIEWLNLGGGYLFDETTNWAPFEEAVHLLKSKYDLEVFFEPGKGIVGEAGYIISTVVDVFESGDKNIAILDTTVNHMPEVFEYQYKPSIMQESETGKYRYILGGASCLAGDLFGEYSFDEPLKVGSKIVFEDMGAYTLVKAHMFNGINLPTIYLQNMDGELELIREFDYEDFLSRSGAKKHDTIRKVAYDIKAS